MRVKIYIDTAKPLLAWLRPRQLTDKEHVAVDNFFIFIDGLTNSPGAGDTQEINGKEYIEISDFTLSVAGPVTSGGGPPTKPDWSALSVDLPVNYFTPLIVNGCVTGHPFTEADLIVQRGAGAGASVPVTAEHYHFTNLVVVDVSLTSPAAANPVQSIRFQYTSLQLTCYFFTVDGTVAGNSQESWVTAG